MRLIVTARDNNENILIICKSKTAPKTTQLGFWVDNTEDSWYNRNNKVVCKWKVKHIK